MNRQHLRPRLHISHGPKKKEDLEPPPNLGNLSPDLQPCSPPVFCPHQVEDLGAAQSPASLANLQQGEEFLQIGKYVIHRSSRAVENCSAVDTSTGVEFLCKIVPASKYRQTLAPYLATDGHPNVSSIWEVIWGHAYVYVFFQRGHGDLHSYVREKKKLRQAEARALARQVIDAVRHCHENGVVLRDLKLRKFVFKDVERTELRLDGLDDAVVLDDLEASDTLTDKHGCPAYVSPEILSARNGYSGKRADLWSLGVMIYTMLVGRYPFQDREPIVLFGKIRRGAYKIPDVVPARARCLVRNLLRKDPSERLSAEEALEHPWFTRPLLMEPTIKPAPATKGVDQTVPDWDLPILDLSLDLDLPN